MVTSQHGGVGGVGQAGLHLHRPLRANPMCSACHLGLPSATPPGLCGVEKVQETSNIGFAPSTLFEISVQF